MCECGELGRLLVRVQDITSTLPAQLRLTATGMAREMAAGQVEQAERRARDAEQRAWRRAVMLGDELADLTGKLAAAVGVPPPAVVVDPFTRVMGVASDDDQAVLYVPPSAADGDQGHLSAAVAHEIAHLTGAAPRRPPRVLWVIWALLAVLLRLPAQLVSVPGLAIAAAGAVLAGWWLTSQVRARREELRADVAGAELLHQQGLPGAHWTMSGLASAAAGITTAPWWRRGWERWLGWTSTHPHPRRRMNNLGRHADRTELEAPCVR